MANPIAGNWQAGVVVNFTSGFGSALRLGFRSLSRNTVPVGPSEPVRRGEDCGHIHVFQDKTRVRQDVKQKVCQRMLKVRCVGRVGV